MIHTSVNLHETRVAYNTLRITVRKSSFIYLSRLTFGAPLIYGAFIITIHSAQIPVLNYVPASLLKRK